MENQNIPHVYRQLFSICFEISSVTFGGGMVIMSILQKKFVEDLKWIEEDEMMDLIAIAQSCPGVMCVNSAVIIGYRVAGIKGALAALIGTVLPPMVILSIISVFYTQFRDNYVISLLLKGMQAGVSAVLIYTSINMSRTALKDHPLSSLLLLLGSLIALLCKVDIIAVILICGAIGGITTARTLKGADV